MSEKHLTETGWKTLSVKQKVKEPKLDKALAEFGKCDEKDGEGRLKALAVIEKEAEALKKAQKANKEITEYLTEMVKEVEKSRKAAELLLKKGAKEEDKKGKEAETGEEEGDEVGPDIKSALTGAMRKVKGAKPGDPPMGAMVCQMGKLFGVLLGKKVGAGQSKALKEILKGTGHKFAKGTCTWSEKGDIYTFDLESSLSGAASGLKAFFKEHAGASYKLRVGSAGVMEEDLTEGGAGDAAAAFKKRLEGLLPKIKTAITAGGPKAQDIKLKASEAGVFAKKENYTEANKCLDAAEELLGGGVSPTQPKPEAKPEAKPTAPTGAPTLSTYVKAKRDWKAAKAAVEKNVAALKAAILQQCDPELEAPVKAKIDAWDGIVAVLDDSVLTVIEEAIKEPDEERQAARNKTLAASFNKMLAALHQHPLISVADSNPFGKFAIRGPAESMLTNLGAAFSH